MCVRPCVFWQGLWNSDGGIGLAKLMVLAGMFRFVC